MMKCMSCEAEINPKWKYAIDSNVCPFCGQNVVDDKLRELFVSLREIMDELGDYSEQLEDWLLSNYNFVRTTSPMLVNFVSKDLLKGSAQHKQKSDENAKFTVKVKTDKGEEEVIAEKIQSDETTNEFFKRAEAVKPNIDGFKSPADKTQQLKMMANQIKRAGSKVITSEDVAMMSEMSNIDEEGDFDVEEINSLVGGNSSGSYSNNEDDIDIPPALLALSNKNSNSNTSDLIKLQEMQNRVNRSKKAFGSGSGGFSRA